MMICQCLARATQIKILTNCTFVSDPYNIVRFALVTHNIMYNLLLNYFFFIFLLHYLFLFNFTIIQNHFLDLSHYFFHLLLYIYTFLHFLLLFDQRNFCVLRFLRLVKMFKFIFFIFLGFGPYEDFRPFLLFQIDLKIILSIQVNIVSLFIFIVQSIFIQFFEILGDELVQCLETMVFLGVENSDLGFIGYFQNHYLMLAYYQSQLLYLLEFTLSIQNKRELKIYIYCYPCKLETAENIYKNTIFHINLKIKQNFQFFMLLELQFILFRLSFLNLTFLFENFIYFVYVADDFLLYKSNLELMSSNQVQLKFMTTKLRQINKKLGNNQGKKSLANSQFDFLQQQFLSKRHHVEQLQDIKEKDGLTSKNAHIGQQIRQGIVELQSLYGKLKQQHRRLTKKKKEPQQILQRKSKIVENCENLLRDIQERDTGIQLKTKKTVTITDMKARLLKQIDENNDYIHGAGSDGKLTQNNEEDAAQLAKWKKKDEQIDVMVDEITAQVQGLKKKVVVINEHQDVINEKTKKADKKAQKLQKRIKKDNDQLKTIIQKMKPSSCCLYLSLFLLAVGLVVSIVKLLL